MIAKYRLGETVFFVSDNILCRGIISAAYIQDNKFVYSMKDNLFGHIAEERIFDDIRFAMMKYTETVVNKN